MPYKRKDSADWWVSYIDSNGKRVRQATGTTNRKEAQALEAKWKLEAYKQQQWSEQPSHTFDELLLGYLKATQAEKRSTERDRRIARWLREYLGDRDLESLIANDVRGYIEWRRQSGVTNATINRELALWSSATNYARTEWDWDIPNPVMGRRLREPEGCIRWIARGEAQALIAVAEKKPKSPYLADFIRLALNTGCRSGEMLGLEWSRVDLQRRIFHLEDTHTKTKRRRSVPLNEQARSALLNRARFRAERCPDSPWVFCNPTGQRIASVKRSFTTACNRAGIADFRIHDMRHTCAAWMVQEGVSIYEVKELLGHSTIKMTERYAHLAPENIRDAVAVLDGAWSRFGHGDPAKDKEKVC